MACGDGAASVARDGGGADCAVSYGADWRCCCARHPDVPFYEIDRVAFALLVVGVAVRAVVKRDQLLVVERATWPMIGLTLLAVASVIAQPFDNQTWCLLAAKFIVPFALFHLAGLVFREERRLRQFEMFSLVVLAYLCFTAIAFLVGAKSLIFPRFILDEGLGYHVDRARGRCCRR